MQSNKVKIALALLVVIIIFSVLSWLYWDFVREAIATPIYFMLWLGDLTLKSIPQEVFLALLVVMSVLIGLNTLANVRAKRLAVERERSPSAGISRYMEWKRLCETQVSNQFVRNQFAWETRKMILRLLAYQEGIDIEAAEEMVKNGSLEVPDVVRNLMRRQEIPVSYRAQESFRNPFLWLRQVLLGIDLANTTPIDPFADEIVAFIEQRLEINHAGNPEG